MAIEDDVMAIESEFTKGFSGSNQKIDPSRRRDRSAGLKPDGSPDENDRVEIGPTQLAFDEWAAAGLEVPNLDRMREYRLSRLVEQLNKRGYGGIVLFDPLNIRYATDTTNMQLWITHNPGRACFVGADGHICLFDFHNCEHLSAHLPLVKEHRHGASFFYFETGPNGEVHAAKFAANIDDLMKTHAAGNKKLAIDKIEIDGLRAFDKLGYEVKNGQEVTEFARLIKSVDEINASRCAVHSCERAMDEMRAVMRAGITENDMWAELHAGNIRRGGEWIETRILSSGPRTNPWFQECGPRVVSDGELLSFDTDLVGVWGFCSDISRTWLIGDGDPTEEQKTLYKIAHEHIMANMELLKPGVAFEEITEKSHRLPEIYRPGRYGVIMHGVGLCDEYPSIRYPEDYEEHGYDGVVEEGMILCVEAYVGADGGEEGVKLEDQVVITADGFENLTKYPFEEKFLS